MATASDRIKIEISLSDAGRISEMLGYLASSANSPAVRTSALDLRHMLMDLRAEQYNRILGNRTTE